MEIAFQHFYKKHVFSQDTVLQSSTNQASFMVKQTRLMAGSTKLLLLLVYFRLKQQEKNSVEQGL